MADEHGHLVSTNAYNVRLRLFIAAAAVVASLFIYLSAEARGISVHDFYRAFARPWGSVVLSWCVVALCVGALAAIRPLFRHGSWRERISGFGISIVPVLILFAMVCGWSINGRVNEDYDNSNIAGAGSGWRGRWLLPPWLRSWLMRS